MDYISTIDQLAWGEGLKQAESICNDVVDTIIDFLKNKQITAIPIRSNVIHWFFKLFHR